MRQQGVVARWCRGVDAKQDRAEPVVGVDAVGMARGKERAVHGDVLGSDMRSGKEPVLAAEGNRTNGISHQAVADPQMTVMEVCRELGPQAHAILHGLAERSGTNLR